MKYVVKRSKNKRGYWAVYNGKEETMYSYRGPKGKANAKAKAVFLNSGRSSND